MKRSYAHFTEKFLDLYFSYPAYLAHPVLFMIQRKTLYKSQKKEKNYARTTS